MIKIVVVSASIASVVVGGLYLYQNYKKNIEVNKAKMYMNRSTKYCEYILKT